MSLLHILIEKDYYMEFNCVYEWNDVERKILDFFSEGNKYCCSEYPYFDEEKKFDIKIKQYDNGDILISKNDFNRSITLSKQTIYFLLSNENTLGIAYLDYVYGLSFKFFKKIDV